MNPWIRLYRESLHDPKIVTLSDRLHRAWHNCLLIADDHGALPSMRDIAAHLRVTVPDAEQLICDLVEAELIDADVMDGRRSYSMHGWAKRQYVSDSSTERTRNYRQKMKMKRHSDGDVTPPEPEPDSDTDLNNYPSSLDAEAKSEVVRSIDFFGLGRGGSRSVSHEAKRTVCATLGIGDCSPLLELYDAWPASKRARSPDALFKKSAAKIYAQASPEVRKACLPIADIEPEPLPAVKPSSELLASLKGGRNARTVRSY